MHKPITRRGFLHSAAAGVSAVTLGGCSAPVQDEERADASACRVITADNIEGPYFVPDSPTRNDIADAGVTGTRLEISGRVVDTRCAPIAGAVLDFWQADADGNYDDEGFVLRGHQFTDADGRYRLGTIIPGRYLDGGSYRPAHIHVKVAADGFPLLTTQLYFVGDPYNDSDPWYLSSLAMTLADGPDDSRTALFDFILVPSSA